MPLRIAASPKCHFDAIAGARTMCVFDWIAMSRSLDCDGFEMYEGVFTPLDPGYLDSVGDATRATGRAVPSWRHSAPPTTPRSPPLTRRCTTTLQIDVFLRAVWSGRQPLGTGEDGRAVVELFTAIQ
jgi:hypothetical protein